MIEDFLRTTAGICGLFVGIAFRPLSKEIINRSGVKYSISRCWRLGRAILEARKL